MPPGLVFPMEKGRTSVLDSLDELRFFMGPLSLTPASIRIGIDHSAASFVSPNIHLPTGDVSMPLTMSRGRYRLTEPRLHLLVFDV